jgi:hypothetical protein
MEALIHIADISKIHMVDTCLMTEEEIATENAREEMMMTKMMK